MFRHIGNDEAGVSAPEYAVLLLLLVGTLVVAVGALNGATTGIFNNAASELSDTVAASGAGASGNGGTNSGPSSSPTNSPPSSNGGGHGKSDDAPGHTKSACSTPAAKCVAPGHSK